MRDKFDLEGKKQQAKEYIASLMKPTEEEMDYMERFIAKEYRPELLFKDTDIADRLKDHSKAFWSEVGKVLPDYNERRKKLKAEGKLLRM